MTEAEKYENADRELAFSKWLYELELARMQSLLVRGRLLMGMSLAISAALVLKGDFYAILRAHPDSLLVVMGILSLSFILYATGVCLNVVMSLTYFGFDAEQVQAQYAEYESRPAIAFCSFFSDQLMRREGLTGKRNTIAKETLIRCGQFLMIGLVLHVLMLIANALI